MGCALSARVSPGLGLLELGHRAEVAGLDLRHRGLGSCPGAAPGRRRARRRRGSRCGPSLSDLSVPEYTRKRRDAPGVRIDDGLEHEGGERRVGRGLARGSAPCARGPCPRAAPRSAGEGRRSTIASRSGWTPTLRSDEAGSTGKSLPASTAVAQALARGRRAGSVPFSKNSSISSSLVSATISTSLSQGGLRPRPSTSSGTSTVLNLPLWSSRVDVGPSRERGRPRPRSPSPRRGGWPRAPRRGRRPPPATRGCGRRRPGRGPCGSRR